MLGHLTALLVVLAMAMLAFALARPAFQPLLDAAAVSRLRNTFIAVTAAAFLAPSIWLYAAALAGIVALCQWPEGDRAPRAATLWALLLLAVPPIGVPIPGFGGIALIFDLDHIRAISLLLLLPVLWMMPSGPRRPPLGGIATDWFVLGYAGLQLALIFPSISLTDCVRQTMIQFMDLVLPYYVFSRAFMNRRELQGAIAAFVIAAIIIGALGVFEWLRTWPLYHSVQVSWRVHWGLTGFLMRSNMLRAQSAPGHSLALGFTMVVSLGLWSVVMHHVRSRGLQMLATAALAGGLVASLARGSWVGAALLLVLLALLGRQPGRSLGLLLVLGTVGLAAVLTIPQLKPVADLLPFVGSVESENIDYRRRLVDVSLALLAQSPWFGVPGFMAYMESMRQGQGLIDIVNTYISVALNTGVVGVTLFSGIFLTVVWRLVALRLRLGARADEAAREDGLMCGRIASTLLAVMFVISTTSGISVIPSLYVMVLGLGVSAWRVVALDPDRQA